LETGLRITPLDIRNHAFPRMFGGYARDEVDGFLDMVSEDYEALLREAQALQENVIRLEVQVERLSSNEAILQETLTTAQKLSEDLKRTAVKEAENLIGEAEVRAEKVLDAAHRRATRLAGDLREMKQLRTRLAASVRSTIDTHIGLLDALAKDPPEEPSLGSSAAFLARPSPDPTRPGSGPDPIRPSSDPSRAGSESTHPSSEPTHPGPDATGPGPGPDA
jgi:cell division initiation protein